MRPEDIRALLRQRPFEPFRLVLTDGTRYDIQHPELLIVERSTVKIGFPAASLPMPLTHREVVVSLLHIIRLEPIQQERLQS
jgi:hypothetical protein